MVTRLLLGATLLGVVLLPAGTASACDPHRFPYCQTYCGAVASRYRELTGMIDPPPPAWPETGVAGCP